MKKRITALLVFCVMAISTLLPLLSSCDWSFAPMPTWDSQVKLTKDGVELELTKVEGASDYKIYHSPSRYGNYELVSTQTKLKYENADKYGYYRVDAVNGSKVLSSELLSYDIETFGDNVRVYAATDDQSKIQQEIDAACDKTGQFSKERFAALFKKGNYDNLDLRMRYYMTFAGLSEMPTDVQINRFNVWAELGGGNATCNFWCGIENMTINNDTQWAVSQATSFRRMKVNGNLALTQKGEGSPWGSGGFISESEITGTIDAGYQQQWLTRNSKWGKWIEGDMNLTFVGSDATSVIPEKGINGFSTVTVEAAPVLSDKPFLVFDKQYYVCVPELRENAKGVSWLTGEDSYDYIPLDEFYVARADRDTAETINAALKNGKHVYFTPGIYKIDEPILVENENTIVMGNGLASLQLTENNTKTIMLISDVDGVKVSGLIFDAGPYSKTLLQVGEEKTDVSHADNPIAFNDIYFRIGGAEDASTYVKQTLVINANDVLGDNFWIWRADHSYGVAWEEGSWVDEEGNEHITHANVTENGAIINGDNVTIYGLMVEHFHEYQTIWNGENGYMVFYQSETPYDVARQEDWMSNWNGKEYQGYASYKVGDDVQKHTALGIGVYFVGRGHLTFVLDHGVELPSNPGIKVEHMIIANFSSSNGSGIRHIVNEYGQDVIAPYRSQKTQWSSFIAGVATE